MNAMAGGHPHLTGRGGINVLAWLGGLLATIAAGAIGAILAVFFAATLVVITLMGAVMVGLAGLAMRARRTARDPQLIEAHNVGGHSWVAYGWDRRSR
jgi:predicted lipid-binding transport protein (Tim44 family)